MSSDDEAPAHGEAELDVETEDDGLPVVARLVVEIRSDGSRTVARGAMEDLLRDERVALEARAGSPVELAGALTKLLLTTPRLARQAIRDARGQRALEPEAEGTGRGAVREVRRLATGVADRLLGRIRRR